MMQLLMQKKKWKKRKLSCKVVESVGMMNWMEGFGVEVIVYKDDVGEWIKLMIGEIFYINEDVLFLDLEFEFMIDVLGFYVWKWVMIWSVQVSSLSEKVRGRIVKNFGKLGIFIQDDRYWDV